MIKKLAVVILFSFSLCLHGQDNIKEVTILHWNDFHAHNLQIKESRKNRKPDEQEFYYYGGTANMLGYVEKNRTKNTLVLNAGDDFQGSPLCNFTRGRSQIELLNLFKIDAFVLGNHEFDYGDLTLDSALGQAKFDYLSANVYFKPKSNTMGKPYVIKKVNGVKFGIIGITAPDLEELSLPQNLEDVQMLNTDSVIVAGIAEMKRQKCNVIILLTHEGVDNDKLLAEKYYKDVDIIVGGHSHTPLFQPLIDSGVIIVQAGAYSKYLGRLDIKVDVTKDTVISCYGKLIETFMDSSIYDKAAEQKVEEMVAAYAPQLNRIIGNVETDWRASYGSESNLGQFEADAFRQKCGTDIAFINGGGLRKSLSKGDITVNDIWEINPFGNELYTFSVSGKVLKEMINNNTNIRLESEKQKKGSEILDVSGMTYTYDSRKAGADVLTSIRVDGADIDDSKNYSIATNNFVTSQFKKFFGEISDKSIVFRDTGLIDRDVIIEAVEKQKVVKGNLETRIEDVSNER